MGKLRINQFLGTLAEIRAATLAGKQQAEAETRQREMQDYERQMDLARMLHGQQQDEQQNRLRQASFYTDAANLPDLMPSSQGRRPNLRQSAQELVDA